MKRLKTEKSSSLTFYTRLGVTEIDYTTFKSLINKRIKLLQLIEEKSLDLRHIDLGLHESDVTSHFLCRLVCSQTTWAASWFVNLETQLFKIKLNKFASESRSFFFKECFPYLSKVVEGRKVILEKSSSYDSEADVDTCTVLGLLPSNTYLVHFTKVLDLVSKRLVPIKGGYCELNDFTIKSVLAHEFRAYLQRKMNYLHEHMAINRDERLQRLCSDIFKITTKTSDFKMQLDAQYFPLCIQGILETLKKTSHLKYQDRQTLCLFLKDAGMSVEEAVVFFRSNFKVTKDVFDKEYLYSIRHNYGLEGKRANYGCHNCSKIAGNAKGFGCPFISNREWIKGKTNDIEDISPGQRGCVDLLSRLVNTKIDRLIYSPIRYYDMYRKSKDEKKD